MWSCFWEVEGWEQRERGWVEMGRFVAMGVVAMEELGLDLVVKLVLVATLAQVVKPVPVVIQGLVTKQVPVTTQVLPVQEHMQDFTDYSNH